MTRVINDKDVELCNRLRETANHASEQWLEASQKFKESDYTDPDWKFAAESLWRFRCLAVAYANLANIRRWKTEFGLTIPGLVIPDEIFDGK